MYLQYFAVLVGGFWFLALQQVTFAEVNCSRQISVIRTLNHRALKYQLSIAWKNAGIIFTSALPLFDNLQVDMVRLNSSSNEHRRSFIVFTISSSYPQMDWDDRVVIAPTGVCWDRKSSPILGWASTILWVPTAFFSPEVLSKGPRVITVTYVVFDQLKGEVDVVLSFTNLWDAEHDKRMNTWLQNAQDTVVEVFFCGLQFYLVMERSNSACWDSLMKRARSTSKTQSPARWDLLHH